MPGNRKPDRAPEPSGSRSIGLRAPRGAQTRPTSTDVARRAGVSQSTVSRVLSGSPRVSEDARGRVQSALQELDYAPNAMARAIRTRRSGTIGVALADLTRPFQPELLQALHDAARDAGQRVVLWPGDSDGEAQALAALRERVVDAIVLTASAVPSPELRHSVKQRLPIVLLNRGAPGLRCDQVTSDHIDGGRRAAAYLLSGGHHRRVAVLCDDSEIDPKRERAQGFLAELERRKRTAANVTVTTGSTSHRAGYQATLELLDQPSPPTAVFCTNDTLAFGALDAARTRGRTVPGELWIVGYNDTALASWPAFDLTSLRQDVDAMAAQALALLRRRIEEPSARFRRIALPVELIIRGSTGNHPIAVTGPGSHPRRQRR